MINIRGARTILHSDMNSFYASVEMMLDPSLRGKAVAVCGSTEERHGIVLAKSQLAKKAGVKTGMANWEARQACPELIIVPPQYEQYLRYSKLAHDIYCRYWFQTRLQSKYPMIAATVSYLVVSGYKLYLLMTGKSVEWFAASASIDYIVAAVILLWVYHRHGGPRFSVSRKKAAQLLKSSSSFIVTGLMVSIYANTDKFMLKQMLDETAVGHYAMAVSLASVWGFLLTAVIDSMSPGIMQLRRTDVLAYERRNRQLYAIVFYIAVSASMVFSLGAHWIVKLLYGDAFLPAVRPLRIVVWYMAFSYLGVARNAWIVSENKQKYLQLLYPCAAVVNVALNLLLIPPLGASGAALASLATQISTTFIIPFFIRELRPNAMLMLQAVLLRGVLGKDARADES